MQLNYIRKFVLKHMVTIKNKVIYIYNMRNKKLYHINTIFDPMNEINEVYEL